MKDTNIHHGISQKAVWAVIMRFAAYTLLIVILTVWIHFLAHYSTCAFQDNMLIEWVQFSLLVSASCIFIVSYWRVPPFRELCILLACVSTFAAIRELDKLLDEHLFYFGWKIAYILSFIVVYILLKNYHSIKRQISYFITTPAFVLLWAGFIVSVPISQMLGHGAFLENLMADQYDRSYKRVIEESGELMGYVLVTAGSIESFLYMKSTQSNKPKNQEPES